MESSLLAEDVLSSPFCEDERVCGRGMLTLSASRFCLWPGITLYSAGCSAHTVSEPDDEEEPSENSEEDHFNMKGIIVLLI